MSRYLPLRKSHDDISLSETDKTNNRTYLHEPHLSFFLDSYSFSNVDKEPPNGSHWYKIIQEKRGYSVGLYLVLMCISRVLHALMLWNILSA
jgi:hypothetical protein